MVWLAAFCPAAGAVTQNHFPEGQSKEEQFNEAKIHIMRAFTKASVESDYLNAEKHALDLLEFSRSVNSDEGIADAYLMFARLYTRKRQADTAWYFCRLAKNLYEKQNSTAGVVEVTCQEAVLDLQANRPGPALKKYQTALAMAKESFDRMSEASVLHGMGVLFLKLHDYTRAENYLRQALDLTDPLLVDDRVSVELDLGKLQQEQGRYGKAQAHYEYCLNLMKRFSGNPVQMADCQTNLGNVYGKQGKYDQALAMLGEASAYYTSLPDTLNRASVLGYKAEVMAENGSTGQAEDSLRYGLALIRSFTSLDGLQLKARLSRQLYGLYRGMGRYEQALNAYEQQNRYEKEIYSLQIANQTAELNEKFRAEQKDQENLALKRNAEIQDLRLKNQQNVFSFLLLAVLLLTLLVFLLWRNGRIRARQRNMALEQRLLRSQMNPHFIFNALIAIQSFMYKNDPKEAGSFLSSFARLVRSILENSREEYTSLAKEIQWLQNYVKLQQLRFDNDIEFDIECDPALDVENTQIPPMLVQPFIENALEHGLGQTENPARLTIKYTLYKKWLSVYIRDNGVGFDSKATPKPRKEHASMAIKITRERLKLLNRGKRKKIELNIVSVRGSGTLVFFTIPLISRS